MDLRNLSSQTLSKFCSYLGANNDLIVSCQTDKTRLCRLVKDCLDYHTHSVKGAQAKKKFTRSQYRQLLKWAFTAFKVAVGTVATVVSFGGGADSLTDLLFTVADFGVLASSIVKVATYAGPFKKWVGRIYNLKWTGNPADVKKDMQAIFSEIDADPNSASIYNEVCSVYMNILDNIAALFGSLVSTVIPDDLGATRVIIEMIISQGKSFAGRKPFDALVWFYNKIPKTGREAIKSKESIMNMLNAMVSYLLDLLPNDSDSFFTRK